MKEYGPIPIPLPELVDGWTDNVPSEKAIYNKIYRLEEKGSIQRVGYAKDWFNDIPWKTPSYGFQVRENSPVWIPIERYKNEQ